MIKKYFFILFILITPAIARADNLGRGFFSGLWSEAIIFSPHGATPITVVPTLGAISGYQGKDFSIDGGFTYVFNNFYGAGASDLLVRFGGDYKLRLAIGGNSFLSFGFGGDIARNILVGYIRPDGETLYFVLPKLAVDVSLDRFVLSITSRIYVPLTIAPQLGYSIGAAVAATF